MYSRPKWRSIPRTLSLSPTIEVSTSNDVWGGKVQACVDPFASGPRRDPRPPLPLRSPEGVFFFFFSASRASAAFTMTRRLTRRPFQAVRWTFAFPCFAPVEGKPSRM